MKSSLIIAYTLQSSKKNKVETSTGISLFVPVQQKKNEKNELLEYSEFQHFPFVGVDT